MRFFWYYYILTQDYALNTENHWNNILATAVKFGSSQMLGNKEVYQMIRKSAGRASEHQYIRVEMVYA